VLTRNDFALHLMRDGRKGEAQHELDKALLSVDNNPVLHNNKAAILARSGKLQESLESATKAYHLNPRGERRTERQRVGRFNLRSIQHSLQLTTPH
jgi:Flp pilus assembly protein TadD